jgi:hypothetical protein
MNMGCHKLISGLPAVIVGGKSIFDFQIMNKFTKVQQNLKSLLGMSIWTIKGRFLKTMGVKKSCWTVHL